MNGSGINVYNAHLIFSVQRTENLLIKDVATSRCFFLAGRWSSGA